MASFSRLNIWTISEHYFLHVSVTGDGDLVCVEHHEMD